MVTEDYISFETAKLLKEKGFDENVDSLYKMDSEFSKSTLCINYNDPTFRLLSMHNIPENTVSAPTLQMAMKWLREIHQIFIHIQRCKKFKFFFTIENMNISGENYEYLLGHFKEFERNTYEETCEAAIKYCLENLI